MRTRAVPAAGFVLAGVTSFASLVSLAGGCRAKTAEAGHLVCPHDAVSTGAGCRCAPGLVVLEGACVGARDLDAYCGASPHGFDGCTGVVCRPGEPLDLATHRCSPPSAARAVLARARPIPEDLTLGCHEGRALVLNGDEVACFLTADLCPRGTTWDPKGERCAAVPACAPGEVRAEESGCVRVLPRESNGVAVTDVGAWTRQVLGVEGGDGTARLCRGLEEHTPELDVGPGGARALTVSIALSFPNNDVTQVIGRVETLDTAAHQPVVGPGAAPAQAALDALLVPLRALGGIADTGSASVRVRCTVRGGAAPVLFPKNDP